jgi:hypothetical protein
MTTVPPAEIADATTFASSLTVQGAFTSPGIDDNADAVALTIDSSERVMIGKTDTTFSTAGTVLYGDGSSDHTRNGLLLQLNRITTDGEHIRLLKDGSSVGSIGVNSGDQVYFAASDGMGIKVDTDNTSVEASNASGADNDNAVNLGSSGTRWKDAYLSGGIHLGGTGSANKLSDYEIGTWTPVVTTDSGTIGSVSGQTGRYIKVGKLVQLFYQFNVTNLGTGSGTLVVSGKPFTEDNSAISYYMGLNRPRSGTTGFSELDVNGNIYMYGSSLTVSLYQGNITYEATA